MKIEEKFDRSKGTGYVKTLSVVCNPEDNGGECVTLSVDVFDNGDGLKEGMFTNMILETTCYGVSSSQIKLWCGFEGLAEAVKLIQANLESLKEEPKPNNIMRMTEAEYNAGKLSYNRVFPPMPRRDRTDEI